MSFMAPRVGASPVTPWSPKCGKGWPERMVFVGFVLHVSLLCQEWGHLCPLVACTRLRRAEGRGQVQRLHRPLLAVLAWCSAVRYRSARASGGEVVKTFPAPVASWLSPTSVVLVST